MEKIIYDKSSLKKENLGIRLHSFNFDKKQKYTELIDPSKLDSIIITRPSTISTDIFKLNKNLQVTIYNKGKPTHLILPMNNTIKVINNYKKLESLSKYKKRKLAYTFCKGVCSSRIKVLLRLNETRKNIFVANSINNMRELDRKLISVKTKNELMGLEGNIARQFYRCLNELDNRFSELRRRDGKDLSNILMNLTHTILRNKISLRLHYNDLPLEYGFLHGKSDRNQNYLVWDFAELWIGYIDKLVFYMIQKQIIKESDILVEGNLKSDSVGKIVNLINNRINNQIIDRKINEFKKYINGEGRFSWEISFKKTL